jgi:hypothetical protein
MLIKSGLTLSALGAYCSDRPFNGSPWRMLYLIQETEVRRFAQVVLARTPAMDIMQRAHFGFAFPAWRAQGCDVRWTLPTGVRADLTN